MLQVKSKNVRTELVFAAKILKNHFTGCPLEYNSDKAVAPAATTSLAEVFHKTPEHRPQQLSLLSGIKSNN
ncbi:MAG: hypothetical protein ACE5NM_08890 [Sedimentisphaerales bacterium]